MELQQCSNSRKVGQGASGSMDEDPVKLHVPSRSWD